MSKIDFSQIISAKTARREELVQARAAAGAALVQRLEAACDIRAGHVTLAERLAWSRKEIAARQVLAGDTSAEAMLAAEAEPAGETVMVLAAKIIQNAEQHDLWMASMTGLRRKTLAAITKATTPAAIGLALAEAEAGISVLMLSWSGAP